MAAPDDAGLGGNDCLWAEGPAFRPKSAELPFEVSLAWTAARRKRSITGGKSSPDELTTFRLLCSLEQFR